MSRFLWKNAETYQKRPSVYTVKLPSQKYFCAEGHISQCIKKSKKTETFKSTNQILTTYLTFHALFYGGQGCQIRVNSSKSVLKMFKNRSLYT